MAQRRAGGDDDKLSVYVIDRKGKEMGKYQLKYSDKLSVLRERMQKDNNVNVHRQRYVVLNQSLQPEAPPPSKSGKKPKKAPKLALMDDSKTFLDYGITADKVGERLELEFKDMGPQIGWQTVFFIEYFGPLPMHALPYFMPELFYGEAYPNKSLIQRVAFALIVFHYLKREFETAFIHRFSNATMPIANIFKNCTHYWVFGGFFISYFLYHPKFTDAYSDPNVIYGLAGLMVLNELGNLWAHVTLRNLRPPGTKKRGIPKGHMFNLTSCANYTYELGSWLWFAVLTQTLTCWLFLVISFIPMYLWAQKKHKAYKKEFPDYPKSRKSIIPFII